jgi:hypothetical protein
VDYQFDVDHAKRFGLEEAVMLHNFIFWIRHNQANRKNQHDGRTWTYNTLEAFRELFPFWSVKQIRRILDSLLEQRVLVKGNHNARAYDRTSWYALADESLLELLPGTICPNGQMEKPKRAEGSAQTGGPIPDSKQDKKPEREERAPRPETCPLPVQAPPHHAASLSSLLTRIKQEAQVRGAPLVVGRDFSAGIVELVKAGTSETELLEAFTACIEKLPEKASFFPRDFLKWRKVSRAHDRQRLDFEHLQAFEERQEREEQAKEERAQIRAEQESEEGRELVAAAVARLPWKR